MTLPSLADDGILYQRESYAYCMIPTAEVRHRTCTTIRRVARVLLALVG